MSNDFLHWNPHSQYLPWIMGAVFALPVVTATRWAIWRRKP